MLIDGLNCVIHFKVHPRADDLGDRSDYRRKLQLPVNYTMEKSKIRSCEHPMPSGEDLM